MEIKEVAIRVALSKNYNTVEATFTATDVVDENDIETLKGMAMNHAKSLLGELPGKDEPKVELFVEKKPEPKHDYSYKPSGSGYRANEGFDAGGRALATDGQKAYLKEAINRHRIDPNTDVENLSKDEACELIKKLKGN